MSTRTSTPTRLVFRAAVAGMAALAILAGCGSDTAPRDTVPELGTHLDAVDTAVVEEDWDQARSELEALVERAEVAAAAGDISGEDADRIRAAATRLLERLPEEQTDPETEPEEPVEEEPEQPAEEQPEEPEETEQAPEETEEQPAETEDPEEEPGQGNDDDNPGQGNDDDNPGQGNDDDNPGQGNDDDNPGQGNDDDNPSQGSGDDPGEGSGGNPGRGNDGANPGQGTGPPNS
ncbi:hypothetical protein [Ornithinicoccus halotolerans]|uniref:hypothetical protein n=1 Tax=Ornithinicoccus halotolerans TaxID=1748220 RepID=UPI0012981206|nr:hypothetical protein [Ornithinicoccus halotolerans]